MFLRSVFTADSPIVEEDRIGKQHGTISVGIRQESEQ